MSDAANRAAALLAEALFTTADALGEGATPDRIPGWDSLAHMRLVLALERELGRRLATEEVLSLRSLEALEALLAGAEEAAP